MWLLLLEHQRGDVNIVGKHARRADGKAMTTTTPPSRLIIRKYPAARFLHDEVFTVLSARGSERNQCHPSP